MILSIDAAKAFDKIHHPFMIKSSEETRNRRSIPQHDKGKPIGNIIVNGEKLKSFPLKQNEKRVSTLPTLIQYIAN
jgi:hypothetical protein